MNQLAARGENGGRGREYNLIQPDGADGQQLEEP
jgi:hypothetical protein